MTTMTTFPPPAATHTTEAIQQLFEDPSCCGMTINDLSIHAPNKTILTVDKLRLPASGVVAVMGPSGSGKSTLIKAMSELMDDNLSHKGIIKIHCNDQDSDSNTAKTICSNFAMIWQKPTVFPCSIWDNLKIPLRKRNIPRNEWKDLMEHALEKTGLINELDEQWGKQRAQRLSGGQQQRLSIAMGLLKDANIFLFDEPTSALDPISTEKIERIIKDLGKKKLVILVTHSLGQARRVSDYSAMFHNHKDVGELCEFSPSEAFFKKPASAKSREFIMQETGV